MLATQVQAISAQQLAVQNVLEAALPKTPTSAIRVPEQGGGLALTPKMPAISETVRVQQKFGTPIMATVQKAAMSVGLPPKVRPPPPKQPSVADPFAGLAHGGEAEFQGAADPMVAALSQQSTALTALVAHLASSSDPLGDFSTPWGQQCKFFYKRRAAERAASKRTGYGKQLFLHAGTAANAPPVVPVEAGASYRCRTTSGRPEHASVPRGSEDTGTIARLVWCYGSWPT